MTIDQFWEKWCPCDWPALEPSLKMKREFYRDIRKVIAAGGGIDMKRAKCRQRKEPA